MDIEEDIKILKNLKKYLNLLIYEGTHKIIYNDLGWDEKTIDCINAIEHILAEREQDKKRIKKLEEALLKVKDKNTTLFITCRNSIPKQKVKDKIEYYKKLQNNYIKKYDEVNDILQGMVNVLKELLEEK